MALSRPVGRLVVQHWLSDLLHSPSTFWVIVTGVVVAVGVATVVPAAVLAAVATAVVTAASSFFLRAALLFAVDVPDGPTIVQDETARINEHFIAVT